MMINDFLEMFKLSDVQDCQSCTGSKKCKDCKCFKICEDDFKKEFPKGLIYQMYYELLESSFERDSRPICEIAFNGNISLDNIIDKEKPMFMDALCDYLELECGYEDIISIKYEKKTDLTIITYYGS